MLLEVDSFAAAGGERAGKIDEVEGFDGGDGATTAVGGLIWGGMPGGRGFIDGGIPGGSGFIAGGIPGGRLTASVELGIVPHASPNMIDTIH